MKKKSKINKTSINLKSTIAQARSESEPKRKK